MESHSDLELERENLEMLDDELIRKIEAHLAGIPRTID